MSTMIAADVFSVKPRSGLSAQRKICTGNTVAASLTPEGASMIKATMPIISSGAVSPRAWAIPMIAPVNMPGMATGRTWWTTVCNLEAPTPRAAWRMEGDTAWIAAREVMMTVGQRDQGEHDTAHQGSGTRQAEEIDKDRQTQQAEYDGGYRRQVVDVDLYQIGDAVAGSELFQIDRRRHSDGERNDKGDEKGEKRTVQSHLDARHLGLTGVSLGEKCRIESGFRPPLGPQLVKPGDLHVVHSPVCFRGIRADLSLQVTPRLRMRAQPDFRGLPYQAGIGEHLVPQIVFRASADQAIQPLLVLAAGGVGKHGAQAGLDRAEVVRGIDLLAAGPGLQAKLRGIQVYTDLDVTAG